MFHCGFILLIFISTLNVGGATRRIVSGSEVKTHKKYVVYLIKAENDAQMYDAWLCGGAIVNPYFIVTSAACVLDVEHMYAIAGYEKYISNDKINTDECIKNTKRKVIYYCVPKYYDFDYINIHKWANIDIAVVKVDKPYKRDDEEFKHCSYVPNLIHINYEAKYQNPGTDAMVLGWGHTKSWRQPDDTRNYNTKHLHYASTLIEKKEECKKFYEKYNLTEVIKKYMICTNEKGNLDEKGDLMTQGNRNATGCTRSGCKRSGSDLLIDLNQSKSDKINLTISAELHEMKSVNLNETKPVELNEHYNISVDSNHSLTDNADVRYPNENYSTVNPHGTISYDRDSRKANTYRPGICQNDHGGPLVTWVGSHEVLIGVASVFKVDKEFNCKGPYLFTSTQCNGAFLSCILDAFEKKPEHKRRYRSEVCDSPQLRGYDKYERYISWDGYPDNADTKSNNNNADTGNNNDNVDMDSDNDPILTRPQRPLYQHKK